MNTDQGSQFTASDFIDVLREHAIRISMDGKGCWRDNVFVERLWKTIKYEHVYLHAYDTVSEARAKMTRISISTIAGGRTPHLTGAPRMTCTSVRCRSNSRPDSA